VIALLTNVFPVILGFLGKLIAIKSQASSDALQLAILGNQENTLALDKAREQSNNESPMAALTRRTIIYVILGLVVFSLAAPVIFDIPTVIPTVREGIEFFGLQITQDQVEYVTVHGIIKFEEIFHWATMIVEFYFGAQLAKGR